MVFYLRIGRGLYWLFGAGLTLGLLGCPAPPVPGLGLIDFISSGISSDLDNFLSQKL